MFKTSNHNKDNRKRKKKLIIIVLLLLIVLLLMMYLLGYRVGRIGVYQEISEPTFNEYIKIIKVSDEKTEITNNTELDIFENQRFENSSMIAPRSFGEYRFYIENISDNDIFYNLKFIDKMTNKINMKYKLKLDNTYIKGNIEKYVGVEKLDIKEIVIPGNSINSFVLEWYWEDDDINDTYVGSQINTQYYTLKLDIDAYIMK